jgi:hypothetical protein
VVVVMLFAVALVMVVMVLIILGREAELREVLHNHKAQQEQVVMAVAE